MTDEPQPPPGAESDDDRPIEGVADDAPAREWDGSKPKESSEGGPSKLALVAVALVALLAGAGTAVALGSRGGSCPGKNNALKVEGTTVSATEFAQRIKVLEAQVLYGFKPPTEEAKLAAFRGDAAKGLAVAVLVAHDVEKRNLALADKTVRDTLDRYVAKRFPEGRTQFVQALGNDGISEDDVVGEFRRLLETRALYQAVTADVKVSEEDVSRVFDQRKDQLAVPETRHLRHLVVKTEDEAKAALTRIKGPETFETVAKDVSLDATTKEQGGDFGTVSEAQLDPAFGTAAFAAKKGDTFGPVQTKNGWHVGLVEEITPGHPVTLAEVHDRLRDALAGGGRLGPVAGLPGSSHQGRRRLLRQGEPPRRPQGAPDRPHPQHPERDPGHHPDVPLALERGQLLEDLGRLRGHPQEPAVVLGHESFGHQLVEKADQGQRRTPPRRAGRSAWRAGRAATRW